MHRISVSLLSSIFWSFCFLLWGFLPTTGLAWELPSRLIPVGRPDPAFPQSSDSHSKPPPFSARFAVAFRDSFRDASFTARLSSQNPAEDAFSPEILPLSNWTEPQNKQGLFRQTPESFDLHFDWETTYQTGQELGHPLYAFPPLSGLAYLVEPPHHCYRSPLKGAWTAGLTGLEGEILNFPSDLSAAALGAEVPQPPRLVSPAPSPLSDWERDPVFDLQAIAILQSLNASVNQWNTSQQLRYGPAAQDLNASSQLDAVDLLALNPRWSLISGMDYGIVPPGQTVGVMTDATYVNQGLETLAPHVGFVYQLMPDKIDGFYTYGQSYQATEMPEDYLENSIFDPFTGEFHRAGLQTSFLDGKFSFSASGFYSENSTDQWAASPLLDWHRGTELAIRGKLTKHWKTSLRITGMESSTHREELEEGWRLPMRSTTTSLTAWNRYNLIRNEKHTLAIGLGAKFYNKARSRYANSMIMPGHSRWDVGLFYERPWLDARLYIENILDRGYYSGMSHLLSDPKSPLSIMGQVQLRY